MQVVLGLDVGDDLAHFGLVEDGRVDADETKKKKSCDISAPESIA